MRILVLGYIIRAPYGGSCFHHLQYLLGLKKLGHEVYFYEDSNDYPGFDNEKSIETAQYLGFSFIKNLFSYYGLEGSWSFFNAKSNTWYGLSKNKFLAFCSVADIVINISGVNPIREWFAKIPVRAFIDTDPTFTQIKHLTQPILNQLASDHTCHFSFAENIGNEKCLIPNDGFVWKPTRQPVILEIWKNSDIDREHSKWTTVMQWESYNSQQYNGQLYGMKSLSFEEYIFLPKKLDDEFEVAISSSLDIMNYLRKNGWSVIPSLIPTKTFLSYQDYILASKGEWSVAKHGYVHSNSGWFSERSLSYMASSKPVVIQDTGFSNFLPCGVGLMPFTTLEEAEDSIDRVNSDYISHCKKARQIVEEFFDSSIVLQKILEEMS